ncbi:hypothetical protein ES703_38940 [subsurface metagenome]
MNKEQAILKVQNSVSAKRVLDEIAVAGGYQPTGFRDGFVVYSKNKDGVTEELFVKKIGDKNFEVVRKTIKEGNK